MRRVLLGATALALVGLTGCEYEGAKSLPLPGAKGGGGYAVTMVFDDVTNLVVKETCRAGDVVVGSVESIELQPDLTAEVVCRIEPDVDLAGNAVASLRETSLLGERYVALDPPAGAAPAGVLEPGTRLDQARTSVVPDVEIVFGALSTVLNGGGLANLETISREVSIALEGSDLGATTRRIGTLVGTLDDNRAVLLAALDGLDRLSAELADQRDVIGSAIESVPAGLAVLERQRPRLVRMIADLGELSDVAVPLIRRTKADTAADLGHLAVVLEQLGTAKQRLARAVEGLITYPFPSYTKYVTKGDYAGMFGTISLDIDSFNTLLAAQGFGAAPGAPVSSDDVPLPDPDELQDLLDDVVDGLGGTLDPLLDGTPLGDTPLLGGLFSDSEAPVGSTAPRRAPQTLADLLTGGAR